MRNRLKSSILTLRYNIIKTNTIYSINLSYNQFSFYTLKCLTINESKKTSPFIESSN